MHFPVICSMNLPIGSKLARLVTTLLHAPMPHRTLVAPLRSPHPEFEVDSLGGGRKRRLGVTIEKGLIITNYCLKEEKKETGSHNRKKSHFNQRKYIGGEKGDWESQ